MGTLTGQVAMISGGLGDIGRACAVELARRGADIAVGDLRVDDRVEHLRKAVEGLGRRFRFDEATFRHPFLHARTAPRVATAMNDFAKSFFRGAAGSTYTISTPVGQDSPGGYRTRTAREHETYKE